MYKVAIVTGASRGIGEAIVKEFKKCNIDVVGVSRSINGSNNVPCDITDEKSVQDLVWHTADTFGRIDILVNCAGIATRTNILDMDVDEWRNTMETNLTGPFLMCKHVIPHMMKNRFGRIINIGSIAGISRSKTASVAYTCSKHGMTGLTKQLAPEYAKYGITVNCLCPSQTETKMLLDNMSHEHEMDQLSNANPSKRLAWPQDIANAATFIASESAEYINGAIIPITGGIV